MKTILCAAHIVISNAHYGIEANYINLNKRQFVY